MMAIRKVKPEAGQGGGLGRSNMAYSGSNDEAKAAGRRRRRQAGHQAIEEGLADMAAPTEPSRAGKKRNAQGRAR
jgi:hypothetical protein